MRDFKKFISNFLMLFTFIVWTPPGTVLLQLLTVEASQQRQLGIMDWAVEFLLFIAGIGILSLGWWTLKQEEERV